MCHLQSHSPICSWFLPEDAWARGRALGWGTGTLAVGLNNCSCCRSCVERVANRIGYNGGSIRQDYCWEGQTSIWEREQIRRSSSYLRKCDDKGGVCRVRAACAPLTPSTFTSSAFTLLHNQYLHYRQFGN